MFTIMRKQVNIFIIDLIKAVAIILVVFGHAMQLGSGKTFESVFLSNPVVIFIYSFHMPIFMLISGYLYNFSINKYSFKTICKKKLVGLVVPILSWNIIITLLDLFSINNKKLSLVYFFKVYVGECIGNLWFLWAVIICSVIILIVNKLFKDNIIIYLAIFIISFFSTDMYNFNLYKYMYPFFLVGYIANRYNVAEILKKVNSKCVVFIFTIIYVIMLFFWKTEMSIYISGFRLLGKESVIYQFCIDIFRYIIGFLGSFIFIYFISIISKKLKTKSKSVLTYIGKNTMGIYIISDLLSVYILKRVTSNISELNYIITCVETLVILIICLIIIEMLKKIKVLNFLFLGNKN